ncbi:MAG TPA: hypothetical protein VHA35_02830 [Dongiaceae bacterium]|jgi:hypothetical protein|nr:hypothetical protein [Dongiaceae bacterium]
MKAGILRLSGGASIIAAAVSILSAQAAAAPITFPPTEYYNGAVVTEPNETQDYDGGYVSRNSNVSGEMFGKSWNIGTSNNFNIPRVSAYASVDKGVKGSSSSYLTYYIEFTGPTSTVDVNVQASGATDAAGENALNSYGHNRSSAWFRIAPYIQVIGGGYAGDPVAQDSVTSNERGFTEPGLHSFSFNEVVTFTTGMIYQVMMETNAEAWGDEETGDGSRHSTAYVDPYFNTPLGYGLQISAGVGNSAPVSATPLPAALPLFTSALGGLGLLGWRRRKRAAAPAA